MIDPERLLHCTVAMAERKLNILQLQNAGIKQHIVMLVTAVIVLVNEKMSCFQRWYSQSMIIMT